MPQMHAALLINNCYLQFSACTNNKTNKKVKEQFQHVLIFLTTNSKKFSPPVKTSQNFSHRLCALHQRFPGLDKCITFLVRSRTTDFCFVLVSSFMQKHLKIHQNTRTVLSPKSKLVFKCPRRHSIEYFNTIFSKKKKKKKLYPDLGGFLEVA